MASIDIGAAAIDRWGSGHDWDYTLLNLSNPANATGEIQSIELYASHDMSGVKVGTFYEDGGANHYTCRDSYTIGNVTAGSKQTFSGLSIEVQTGDVIGCYYSSGRLEISYSGGSGVTRRSGDAFSTSQAEYTPIGGDDEDISLYGEGYIIEEGACSIAVSAAVSAEGLGLKPSSCTIDITSSLSAMSEAIFAGEAAIAVVVSVIPTTTTFGSVVISAVPSMSIGPVIIASGAVDISAVSSILADVLTKYGTVVIEVSTAASFLGGYVVQGGVAISASASLSLEAAAYLTALLGYTGTLTAGDELVIDTDAMTVKLNGADARANFTGEFWQLWPGENELEWTDDDGSRNVSVEIDHEPRWL